MNDLLNTVQKFMIGVLLPRVVASTSIVLLPKKDAPFICANYQSIGQCNVLNKIMTKIICS